jgi:acyl-CoA thioesterase FadM
MSRTKIELPSFFPFHTNIPVRITDLNYGGHVGNDTVLSIIHEARMQYLLQYGFTEMNASGVGMIMADVTIQYKSELFYGDVIRASVAVGEMSRVGFDLYYLLEKEQSGKWMKVAAAKTGMICYDYEHKRIASVPQELRKIAEPVNPS